MKTSNVLLLSALAFIVVISIIGLFLLRNALESTALQGDGNIVETQRQVGDFEKIKIIGRYNVIYAQDSQKNLVINTDANLHEHIRTEVKNNQLVIDSKQSIRSRRGMNIEISNAFITHVEATSGAKFHTANKLQLPGLHLVSNAGSVIEILGIFENVSASQNAGAKVILAGKTEQLDISANAGGSVDASEMEANIAKVQTNTGSSVTINAAEIDARANTGGVINYIGDPVFHNLDVSAGGRVNKK